MKGLCVWASVSLRLLSSLAFGLLPSSHRHGSAEKSHGAYIGSVLMKQPVSTRMYGVSSTVEQQRKNQDVILNQSASSDERPTTKRSKGNGKSIETFNVTTLEGLESYFSDESRRFRNGKGGIDYDELLASLHVAGDTQIIGSRDHLDTVHPVVQLLHERRNANYRAGQRSRSDGCRVALVVEGGGMRGCVSAGMVGAIHYLGLEDTVDVVYGSSAGSIIAAYFITRQLPWFGPEIYYDSLTTAGRRFIDTRRLLRAIGFGLFHPLLIKDVIFRPNNGKPVLNLPFLLKKTASENKPLNWKKFKEQQKVQPLKVVASGLNRERSVVMDMERGSFETMEELASCMHASCLLPGIAGPLMHINERCLVMGRKRNSFEDRAKFVLRNNFVDDDYEPMADALLYEPLPYSSAIAEGATHVIVLRTRPDGVDTTGRSSLFERLIFRRFFLRKNKLPRMYRRLRKHLHKKLYAKDIITLNNAARDDRDPYDLSGAHIMTVALPPGSKEVSRLETSRQAIFEGVRRGFARAYDALVEDPRERGKGEAVARSYFPNEIMDYDPVEFASMNYSAFEEYLKHSKNERMNQY